MRGSLIGHKPSFILNCINIPSLIPESVSKVAKLFRGKKMIGPSEVLKPL